MFFTICLLLAACLRENRQVADPVVAHHWHTDTISGFIKKEFPLDSLYYFSGKAMYSYYLCCVYKDSSGYWAEMRFKVQEIDETDQTTKRPITAQEWAALRQEYIEGGFEQMKLPADNSCSDCSEFEVGAREGSMQKALFWWQYDSLAPPSLRMFRGRLQSICGRPQVFPVCIYYRKADSLWFRIESFDWWSDASPWVAVRKEKKYGENLLWRFPAQDSTVLDSIYYGRTFYDGTTQNSKVTTFYKEKKLKDLVQ